MEGDDKEQKKDGDEEHVANVNNLLTVDIDEMMGVRWGLFECKYNLIIKLLDHLQLL